MAIYLNPTGTFDATNGSDTIIFDTFPVGSGFVSVVDALGGTDSLVSEIVSSNSMWVDVSDVFSSGSLHARIQLGIYDANILVYNVETVDLLGSTANDFFDLKLGSSFAGLTVSLNGGAGVDDLKFDWSKLATGISFLVSGTTITSSWGTFSNFESYELWGGSGNDTIVTGSGNDDIYTGAGVDNVNAGAGNDYIHSNAHGGSIDGGSGYDFFAGGPLTDEPLSVTVGDTIDFGSLVVSNVEGFSIGGGSGDDVFTIVSAPNGGSLSGGAGYDTLVYSYVPTSAQQLTFEANGEQLYGSIGPVGYQVSFSEFENVAINGSAFNDSIRIWGSYSGNGLTLNGGAGTDLLSLDFGSSQAGFSFIVAADGTVSTSIGSIAGFENFFLIGGSGADTLTGWSGGDTLYGGGGVG